MAKRGVNYVRKKEDGGLNWDSMMYDVLGGWNFQFVISA
jgi:hypothetical protein